MTARMRSLPSFASGRRRQPSKANRRMAGDHRGRRRTAPSVGYVHDVEAERHAQLFAQEVSWRAKARRPKLYLPGLALMRVTSSATVFAGTEG